MDRIQDMSEVSSHAVTKCTSGNEVVHARVRRIQRVRTRYNSYKYYSSGKAMIDRAHKRKLKVWTQNFVVR